MAESQPMWPLYGEGESSVVGKESSAGQREKREKEDIARAVFVGSTQGGSRGALLSQSGAPVNGSREQRPQGCPLAEVLSGRQAPVLLVPGRDAGSGLSAVLVRSSLS